MDDPGFIKSYSLDGGIRVIKLHGSLDATGTEQFNEEVQNHLDAGLSKMIIDCAHLGFISSLGIGALVVLQTRLKKRGGSVKLAAIQGPVAGVMKVVRLDKALGMYGDIEFARQAFEEESEVETAD